MAMQTSKMADPAVCLPVGLPDTGEAERHLSDV